MLEDQNRTLTDRITLRLPDGLRERIKDVASGHNRSLNAEILATLEEKYPVPDPQEEVVKSVLPTVIGARNEEDLERAMNRYRQLLESGDLEDITVESMEIIYPRKRKNLGLPPANDDR